MSTPKQIRYLTKESPSGLLDDYRKGESDKEHMSSPDGCHPDCPACAEENEWNEGNAWQLDVGAQLNRLLDLVELGPDRDIDEEDKKAILSIVSRVAEFGELESEP
jgi:hypothetical protein